MVISLKTEEYLVLEENGAPIAVVMTYERYQEIMDYIDDLESSIAVYQTGDDIEPTIDLEDYISERHHKRIDINTELDQED